MTNKELFIQELNKHWFKLKNNDETIFENIGIQLDAEEKFEELKENYSALYGELLYENSLYNKKQMISEYFWSEIVGELYEHTVRIMGEAGILEESQRSFENSYKIETTARLILENGIFAKFSSSKKKELTDLILEAVFYPNMYQERMNTNFTIIEEGVWGARMDNFGTAFGAGVTGIARTVRSLSILLTLFLVSPATILFGNLGDQLIDSSREAITGKMPPNKGANPTMRKFYSFIESFWPVKIVYKFLHKDNEDLYKFIKQTNNLENEYIQDILKTAGGNSRKIVAKCWQRYKLQPSGKSSVELSGWEKIKSVMREVGSGRALSNFLRDPQYNDETQLAVLLRSDATDPKYQKQFFDFRVCVFDKLFEVILGYAKAIYSMDDASYEIIKAANDAHQKKNYKAFFDLRPKQDNERAMFVVMKALVAITDISETLKKRKGELLADQYIDRFSQYLDQNIKQTYEELNQMASQRKFNADRYDDDQPDDETKAEAIAAERFNQKKSIFS